MNAPQRWSADASLGSGAGDSLPVPRYVLNKLRQGLCMFDGRQRLLLSNDRYAQIYDLSPGDLRVGMTLRDIIDLRFAAGTGPNMSAADYAEWRERVMVDTRVSETIVRLRNGRTIEIYHEPTAEGGWVATHDDITERQEAELRIAHMASHDALTNLPNRQLFRARLDFRLAEIAREGGSCAVVCLDLDAFKDVNDTFGHLAGDALLQEVAGRMQCRLGAQDTLARLGGDEFVILLSAPQDVARVLAVAESLIDVVASPVDLGGQAARVGLSIGIAMVPDHGADADTLLRRADLALYKAKANGRNNACIFSGELDAALERRRCIESDFRRALTSGEFILHYQPQVCGASGTTVGFEALVRWRHPVKGLIPPDEFIPFAEQSGLILDLGEAVLRIACTEASQWSQPLKIAVNVSARQFQQCDLPERILAILIETGLAPDRLELEVTESMIISDKPRALAILRRLKGLGIGIAIDDFGTGHSSLATLHAFPFSKIKIDRSFVDVLERSPQATAIVRAMLGLGQSLGISVVAEGVETAGQKRFLETEECDGIQGFFCGRPLPIEHYRSIVYGAGLAEPTAA